MLDCKIDVGRETDRQFIGDSWAKSYATHNDVLKHIRHGVYKRGQYERITRVLARASVFIARPDDWPEGIIGYIVTTPGAVHWWHVKRTYRANGVGRRLLHHALERMGVDPEPKTDEELSKLRVGPACYTHHRTPYVAPLWRRGLHFDPYELERLSA